jgi:hypothetical protein
MRKSDPGPGFQLESLRASVLGRKDDDPEIYETTVRLNIRSGPGSSYDELDGSPLPRDTRIEVKGSKGAWRFCDVLDQPDDVAGMEGWVHGRYLRPVT